MTTSNRVAHLHPDGVVRIERHELPALAPDLVRVDVAFAGICGSDLHVNAGALTAPLAMGHEQSGVVSAIGSAVRGVEVGQHVSVLPRIPCGSCVYCRRDYQALCRDFRSGRPGWADHMDVAPGFLAPIPGDVPLEHAATAEPTACALRAVDRANLRPGMTALVIGAGPIGLLTMHVLSISGATTLLVSEPNADRRARAAAAGATVFDPGTGDVAEWARSLTGGLGADAVFDAVGSAPVLEAAIAAAAPGGTVVIVGVAPPDARASVGPLDLWARELTVTTAFGIEGAYARAVDLLRRIPIGEVVTDVFPLDRADEAYRAAKAGGSGKILLSPRAS